MSKVFSLLVLILTAFSLFAQDNGFDQDELYKTRRYKALLLENGLHVLNLQSTDSSKMFLRLYTDIPQDVPKQYRAFVEIDHELQKSITVNLPKPWKNTDLNQLDISLQKDSMGYFLTCPPESLDTAVFLLSKLLLGPTITNSQLAEAKKAYELKQNSPQDPVTKRIDEISKGIIYGKHHPSAERLSKKELDDLLISKYEEYYPRFYLPNNSYLLIMGAVDQDHAVMLAQKYFSKLKKKKLPQSDYKLNKIEEGRVLFFDTLATGKYEVSMIFPFSLHPFTFDYEKSELLSLLIEKELKERLMIDNALVSNIEAGFHKDKISGNYRIKLVLTDSSVARVAGLVMLTVDELKKGQVDAVKLDEAQRELIERFKQKAGGKNNISKLIISSELNNLDDDYYSGFVYDIKTISNKRIASLTRKYLNYQTSIFQVNGKWYPSLNDVLKLSRNFRVELYNLDGSIRKVIPKGYSGFNVLNNYINALGGTTAINRVKDLSIKLTGKYKMSGEELFIIGEIKHKSPNKYYQVLSLLRPKKDTIFLNQQVFDGEKAIDRSMQGKKLLKGDTLELVKYKSVIVPETKYKKWGFKTRILRADTLNDSYVFVVEFTNPAHQKIIDFYDVGNGLRYKRMVEDSAYLNKRTIIYKDYKKIKGTNLLYPFYQHINTKSVDIQFIIQEIDADKKIEKELFKVLEN